MRKKKRRTGNQTYRGRFRYNHIRKLIDLKRIVEDLARFTPIAGAFPVKLKSGGATQRLAGGRHRTHPHTATA
ncbi:hypothetical protein GCM10027048_14010 [Hymenobacter coalescens]